MTQAEVRFYNAECREIDKDGDRIVRTSNKGIVKIEGEPKHKLAFFSFMCPNRPGQICGYLKVRGGAASEADKRPSWEWDRNYEDPTFKPSINCLAYNPKDPKEKYAGCGWHGFITAGTLKLPGEK